MLVSQGGVGSALHLNNRCIEIKVASTPLSIAGRRQTVIYSLGGFMYQRFKLLILFLCAIASATAVFGANAARVGNNVGNNQAHMVSLDSRQQPLTDWGLESSASDIAGKPGSSETAMGYFMSPGIIQIGVTSYDLQHNMRQARQIAVGSDGRVHMVWTHKLVLGSLNTRAVHYRSFKNIGPGGALTAEKSISDLLSKVPGRFCTVDAFGDVGLVVYHWGPSATSSTTDAMDAGSGSGAFYTVSPDIPAGVINCENIYAGSAFQPYIWPVAAADHDANKLVVHAVASEGNTGAGFSAIVYFRGASSSTILEGGMYGTCGKFIDSCSATGYDVAASPYNDDVVIVYPLARQGNRENNDLAYRLSHDIGVTWGDPVNVTNFATGALERVAGDMSVLFTADNCFHILYIGNIYDSLANTVSDQEAKLYHWSSCNPTCKSLVLDANNHDNACNTPAFEYDVSKITLTQCHSNALGKDLLYAVYARQLGTTADPDCSDKGYFNQEVFVSPSSTWGETWGESINLTNTKTDGCDPMAATPTYCADESFTSSARYVNDSLRIEYLEDLDAGSFVSNES
ncbi:MAG: hypothetical protein NT028_09475, partial [candidate division Zixibacteria bacterium]|nr:hypothetical protein [candidate division Zixibacteria bacterium]